MPSASEQIVVPRYFLCGAEFSEAATDSHNSILVMVTMEQNVGTVGTVQ